LLQGALRVFLSFVHWLSPSLIAVAGSM
jgi:hypothetical protein